MTNPHDKLSKIRLLSIALFLSGSFNILLLALLFYWAFQEKPQANFYQLKPKADHYAINEDYFHYVKTFALSALIDDLTKKTGEERELALAALVAVYDFDIKRALSSSLTPLLSKLYICRTGEKVVTFPGLKEEQFQLIINFAKKEKWPLKAKGLFFLLQQAFYQNDHSLKEAFYLTEEYQFIKNLFSNKEIENVELLQVMLDGSWENLAGFCKKHLGQHCSDGLKFLSEYVKNGSKTAALLLLKSDWDFVVNHMKEDMLFLVFEKLDKENARKLALAIAASPRGQKAHTVAEKHLEYSKSTFAPFIPQAKTKEQVYIVQEGDSLWKIAKKYHVDIEEIKKTNYLPSDVLQPGTTLRIPI